MWRRFVGEKVRNREIDDEEILNGASSDSDDEKGGGRFGWRNSSSEGEMDDDPKEPRRRRKRNQNADSSDDEGVDFFDTEKSKAVEFVAAKKAAVEEKPPSSANDLYIEGLSSYSSSSESEEGEERPNRRLGKEIFAKPAVPPADMSKLKAAEKKYGVGAALMAKMGYSGGGLGVTGAGRILPLKVTIRKKNQALQESVVSEQVEDEPLESAAEPEEEEVPIKFKKRGHQFRKRKAPSEDIRQEFESFKEQLRSMETPSSRIIDMTGPVVRVLDEEEKLADLLATKTPPLLQEENPFHTEKVDLDRLKTVQAIIHDLDAKLPNKEIEKKKSDLMAKYSCSSAKEESGDFWDRDEDTVTYGGVATPSPSKPTVVVTIQHLTVEELTSAFKKLKENFPEEVEILNLRATAGDAFLQPVLAHEARNWNFRKEPSKWLKAQLLFWRRFLSSPQKDSHGPMTSRLSRVVKSAVLDPIITPYMRDEWDPESDLAENGLVLVHDWLRLWINPSALECFIETIVTPRIAKAVASWDPSTQKYPPHFWLHPWLPMLSKLTIDHINQTIATAFNQVLTKWKPTDRSAVSTILPWRLVLEPNQWKNIIKGSVWPAINLWLSEASAELSSQVPCVIAELLADWPDDLIAGEAARSIRRFYAPRVLEHLDRMTVLEDPESLLDGYESWRKLIDSRIEELDDWLASVLTRLHRLVSKSPPTEAAPPIPERVVIEESS